MAEEEKKELLETSEVTEEVAEDVKDECVEELEEIDVEDLPDLFDEDETNAGVTQEDLIKSRCIGGQFDYDAFKNVDIPNGNSNNILIAIITAVAVSILFIMVCAISIESRIERDNQYLKDQIAELQERLPEENDTRENTGVITGVTHEREDGEDSYYVFLNYRAVDVTQAIYNEMSARIGDTVTITETITVNEETGKETRFLSYQFHPVG